MIKFKVFQDLWNEDRHSDSFKGQYSRNTLLKKLNEWLETNKNVKIINLETKGYPVYGYIGAFDGELIVYYEEN
jgi:hypothetical protein